MQKIKCNVKKLGEKYIYSVSPLFLCCQWIFARETFSCFLVHLVISLVWIKHTFWTCSVSSTAHLQYPTLLLKSPSNLPFWLFLLPSRQPDSKTKLTLCVDLDDPCARYFSTIQNTFHKKKVRNLSFLIIYFPNEISTILSFILDLDPVGWTARPLQIHWIRTIMALITFTSECASLIPP